MNNWSTESLGPSYIQSFALYVVARSGGPALSASESACSVLCGASMNVLCFMMPVVMLFTLPGASSVPSVVLSVSPRNFLMSLSFLVVRVPDFKFFRS